jgi:predicted RNA-binding Zn ribbon-like protein
MRIVGGNVALDFLNTRSGPPLGPADRDVLGDYAGLLAWGVYAGVLDLAEARRLDRKSRRESAEARRVFERAVRLRDTLDGLFRALATGRQSPPRSRAALRNEEADVLGRAELRDVDGGYAWSWTGDDSLARPLGPVVHAAVELLTGGQLERIKACGGCSFLFVDESKNRSRRWCSMEDCGANEKMRRYIRQRAARRVEVKRPQASNRGHA